MLFGSVDIDKDLLRAAEITHQGSQHETHRHGIAEGLAVRGDRDDASAQGTHGYRHFITVTPGFGKTKDHPCKHKTRRKEQENEDPMPRTKEVEDPCADRRSEDRHHDEDHHDKGHRPGHVATRKAIAYNRRHQYSGRSRSKALKGSSREYRPEARGQERPKGAQNEQDKSSGQKRLASEAIRQRAIKRLTGSYSE